MNKIFALIGFPVALLMLSCGSGKETNNNAAGTDSIPVAAAPVYDASLPKGRAADSIPCRDAMQVFALYIPSYYTTSKPLPCIFFFDPHAHGILPVNTYKDLAEQYGFILVGSDMSKNGMQWPETHDAAKALMNDVRSRIAVDARNIYTSGFSGGSRVAGNIAVQDGGVAGVIGCAAGLPGGVAPQTKFDYFSMVGDQDFNLLELVQFDGMLQANGFAHQLLVFEGKHAWPKVADFKTAMLWLQVSAMKEKRLSKSDSLIAALKNDYEQRLISARKVKDMIWENDLLVCMNATLDSMCDISADKKRLTELKDNDEFKRATSQQNQTFHTEQVLQPELAQQFAQQDKQWWTKKIAELNKRIKAADNRQEALMYKRTLNYIGLVGYMSTGRALQTNDEAHISTFLDIFKMADPQNPDAYFLSAVYQMKLKAPQKAVAALKEAASLGYNDSFQLLNDPAFADIREDAGFKVVAAKVSENGKK